MCLIKSITSNCQVLWVAHFLVLGIFTKNKPKVKCTCFHVNKQRHPWDLSYFVLGVVKTLGLKSASLLSDGYANKLRFIHTTV